MTPDQRKQLEEVVNGLLEGDVVLSPEFKTPLLDISSKLDEYIANTSTINIQTITEEEKDKLYADYKDKMKVLYEAFKGTKYNFTLSEEEYKFLRKQICEKLKYNRQDNVIAVRVKENFFKVAEENKIYKAIADETFQVSIDDMTLISHLNSKIELNGINQDNYSFATITEKIGAISRVYEYFDMRGAEISEAIQNWFAGLETSSPEIEEITDSEASIETEEADITK